MYLLLESSEICCQHAILPAALSDIESEIYAKKYLVQIRS